MKEDGKTYVDTSKVSIREINKSVAKEMIVKYHYSHAWTMCRYALGVYYEDESSFFGEEKLIGCMVYGYPVGRSAVKSVIDILEKEIERASKAMSKEEIDKLDIGMILAFGFQNTFLRN